MRALLFLAAALLLTPITHIGGMQVGLTVDVAGAILFGVVALLNFRARPAIAVGEAAG
jgi:hypothetical protein